MTPPVPIPFDALNRALDSAHEVLVVVHEDPDVDAAGSALAFSAALTARGIGSVVWLPDVMSVSGLAFLPGFDTIVTQLPAKRFDLVAFLDCAEFDRTPGHVQIRDLALPILNIDHHPDNRAFGQTNCILPHLSSTGEILYHWISESDIAISGEMATCLMAAISFDTGRFLYSNTTADTLRAASNLMEKGADYACIMQGLYEQKPIEALDWIKVGLDHLVVDWPLKYAYTVLPGCPASMGRDVIDFIRSLTGIEVFLVFRENDGKIKVNVRSKSTVDVSAFAHQFGGGGHVRASGISFEGHLEDTVAMVIASLRTYLQS